MSVIRACFNMECNAKGYAYFVNKVGEFAIKQGRRPVQWSEVFDHFKTELNKDIIVHIWKGVTNVTEVVADGYNVLLNVGYDKTSWYLDNLNVDWSAVYTQDPCGGAPADLCKLILGGHGGKNNDRSSLEIQTIILNSLHCKSGNNFLRLLD